MAELFVVMFESDGTDTGFAHSELAELLGDILVSDGTDAGSDHKLAGLLVVIFGSGGTGADSAHKLTGLLIILFASWWCPKISGVWKLMDSDDVLSMPCRLCPGFFL